MVAYLDLNIYQNEDFDADISLSKYISKNQMDASEYEIKASIKKHYLSSNTSADFKITSKIDSRTGLFNISLSSDQTSNLRYGKYVYDVFIKDKSRNVGRYSYHFPGAKNEFITLSKNNPKFNLSENNFIFETYLNANNSNYEILNIPNSLQIKVENGNIVISNGEEYILKDSTNQIQLNKWMRLRIQRESKATEEEYKIIYDQVIIYPKTLPKKTKFPDISNEIKCYIGKNFQGYFSNMILVNGHYNLNYEFPVLNPGIDGVVFITCRNYTFKDHSVNNFNVINTTGVSYDYFNPFGSDIVTYKLIEGVAYVNPSSTPKF